MEEKKNSSSKVILLLFPPIINKFNFYSGEKESFFDLGKFHQKSLLEKKELFKLTEIDYSSEVKEFIQQKKQSKLILVNYPRNEKQFTSLNEKLVSEGK